MTPADASNQAHFLVRCALEYAASWPRQSSRSYPGELVLRTAYSTYRVVDGRCIVVQREGSPAEEDEHECLGTHLVGYLLRHDDEGRVRWSLHRSPRPDSKAVFWRPDSGTGHFVVTSRLAFTEPPPRPRSAPPPLPARAAVKAATPSTGVLPPASVRAPGPARTRHAERAGAPPPPPPTRVKRSPRA